MNPRPSGYEPDELPAAPPRGVFADINIINQKQNFKFTQCETIIKKFAIVAEIFSRFENLSNFF